MIQPRAAVLALALLGAVPFAGTAGARLDAQVHECSYCHDVHGGFTSSDVALNRDQVVEQVCLTCHGDAGPGYIVNGTTVNSSKDFQLGVHAGAKHAVGDTTSCWDCHDHEGAANGNLFMIPRTLELPQGGTATVVFTDNTTQAGFTGTQGICYVCHSQPTTQANGLNGHNGPTVCTTCHQHDGGFGGEGGACTSCHGEWKPSAETPNHRPVVGEFDRATHHVQLGGAGVDVPDDDCKACHNQDGHPRSGTTYVVLEDPDGGPTIAYDRGVDDPSVLTPFCIGCHDAGGATRLGAQATTPFSDGNTRPIIDETAWLASSHEGSGGADCADCHESHGSERVRLFTPGDVVPDPTTKYEEEEGFCFGCHSATGGAPDLKTPFDRAINWVQQATGLNSNANLNDRHDVQHEAQSRSGAVIECVSCHDPHRASAALPYRLDPDPTDGHVPGTDWYYYQATADTLSEFCLDCHDGSFPPGVQDQSTPIVNIQTTWADDGMGARNASGTVGLYAPSGWTGNVIMACSACHSPHPVIDPDGDVTNHFAIKDTARSPTGTPLDGWYARVSGQWRRTFAYSVSSNASGADPVTDGGTYCNTCHDRTSMVGKDNCYDCHRHGDGGRW